MADTADVVVVGGSTGAVSASVAAAGKGVRVFLVTDRTYLGEDMCAHQRLWLEPGERATLPLARKVFTCAGPQTPLHVKRTLDQALERAGVNFLFGSYVTDVLRDGAGRPAGVVIVNRTGRQAIPAKVIVDATDRAWVARMTGASFRPYPAGPARFARIVIGGSARSGRGVVSSRRLDFKIQNHDVLEYVLSVDMPDCSWWSFASAEQVARDLTFHPEQVDDSELLFQVPPDPVKSIRAGDDAWAGAGSLDIDCARPAGVERLYVLGGCADVSRERAASLLRPTELIEFGGRIGEAAATEAARAGPLTGVKLPGNRVRAVPLGEVGEFLTGLRPTYDDVATVQADARGLPVLGRYDVVVIGGGTGGAPAGIAAARGGARTLVVEYQRGLGGVSTVGLIGKYYWGNRVGFTAELDRSLPGQNDARYVVHKMEWLRSETRTAGGEIWFGAIGCGALVEDGRVKGVVVATPQGRGVVLAKAVVDSTGNADIAATAGAEVDYTSGEHLGVQGAGLPPRNLGKSYMNTDYTFADDTDVLDFWHLFVWAREKFAGAYDLGQLVDTRERRRIVGEATITPMDIVNGRTYPDTIVRSRSNFDSHGFTVHSFFFLEPPDKAGFYVDVPYRCLLPKGFDGILVTGLAVSAHRDAMPVIRMQPDVQNQGYAAGLAAATAARRGIGVRRVDVRELQRHLVDVGVLPERVLSDKDSYPLDPARVLAAVRALSGGGELALVDDAQPAPAFSVTQPAAWKKSTATRGYVGSGYMTCNAKGPEARFTPRLSRPGTYTVQMRWTSARNRSTRVPVEIRHAGGVAKVTVDQSHGGGKWHALGTFEFAATGAESVVLSTTGTEDDKYVIADAVRFVDPGAAEDMSIRRALAAILAQPDDALPLLREAYVAAKSSEDKLAYAHVLGMLGDPSGARTLAEKVASYDRWDDGWNYKGMRQFGPSVSELDSYIVALARTRSPVALRPILEMAAMLDASEAFSHHRAVAIACETLRSAEPAAGLAAILSKPGMTGHYVTSLEEARSRYGKNPAENEPRSRALRELVVARALFRCGDHRGTGKRILENYARDLRGHFSRHARAVLRGE